MNHIQWMSSGNFAHGPRLVLAPPIVVVVALLILVVTASGVFTAHAQNDAETARENLKSVNRELFKRLFVQRRKEHIEAVKNLRQMSSYERQYKMINVLAEKMFDVIESKKVLLENISESELRNVSFAVDAKNDIQDAISSVLENVALFGDVVLNLPDITQRILRTQPKWNSTMRWSFDFLNRTKDLLDKATLDMIELALQELNITSRRPDYVNPRRATPAATASRRNKEPSATVNRREKRKKGPQMTRIEL